MLPVGWLVLAVVLTMLLSMWITFTLTRLDRLHARVDAARAALDAQLVRRAAALLHVAEAPATELDLGERTRYEVTAQAALITDAPAGREAVENAMGRAVAQLAGAPATASNEAIEELREAATRVQVARRFYNDAVRDTRTLRARRMPRLLRLAGHAEMPQYFDIDDTLPARGPGPPTGSSDTAGDDTAGDDTAGDEAPGDEAPGDDTAGDDAAGDEAARDGPDFRTTPAKGT